MVVYDYIFNSFEIEQTENLTNVVKKVIWQFKGSENDISVFVPFLTEIDPPNPEQFIDFENLTKEIIISWVSEKINLNIIELNIQEEINIIKNKMNTIPPPFE